MVLVFSENISILAISYPLEPFCNPSLHILSYEYIAMWKMKVYYTGLPTSMKLRMKTFK